MTITTWNGYVRLDAKNWFVQATKTAGLIAILYGNKVSKVRTHHRRNAPARSERNPLAGRADQEGQAA
jgi:hypothetical protein